MMTDTEMLERIANDFGDAYLSAKEAESDKKSLQKELFSAFNNLVEPARKTVDCPYWDNEMIENWVKQYHPGWVIIDIGDDEKILLEEDPALMAYSYTAQDGMVYGRSQVNGSPMLDDERLRKEDPTLYESITTYPEPWFSLVQGAMGYVSEDAVGMATVAKYLDEQGLGRALKPIDTLTDEQLQALQEYMVPGRVSVKLTPPKVAKS